MKIKIFSIIAINLLITLLNAEFDVFQIALGSNTEDYSNSIMRTPDNGFIVAGWTTGFGAGMYDAYAVKIDSTGASEWSKTYGGTGNDYGMSIVENESGEFMITGFSNSYSNSNDVILFKTDNSGNIIWSKSFGGNGSDGEETLIGTMSINQANQGYAVTGFTQSFGAGNRDFCIIRTDENGSSGCYEEDIEFEIEEITPTIQNPAYSVSSGGSSLNANNSTSNPITQIEIICHNTVGIENEIIIPENDFQMWNYPNPFNPETTISFSIGEILENTEISIYNIKGQMVKTLIDEKLPAGEHSVVWNGKDDSNKSVSSGVYLYKLKARKYTYTEKMILMK